jgi:heme O synthase-like polyprenyltransferase
MYGMPSGHSASIGYSIIYLLMVNHNSIWLPMSLFIGICTFYQRWKYKRHTIEQIIVGAISGGIIGWIFYYFATQYIIHL